MKQHTKPTSWRQVLKLNAFCALGLTAVSIAVWWPYDLKLPAGAAERLFILVHVVRSVLHFPILFMSGIVAYAACRYVRLTPFIVAPLVCAFLVPLTTFVAASVAAIIRQRPELLTDWCDDWHAVVIVAATLAVLLGIPNAFLFESRLKAQGVGSSAPDLGLDGSGSKPNTDSND